MKATKSNIEKALHAAGFPNDLEIVRGRGYVYFNGADTMKWFTSSVMLPNFNSQTVEQWVKSAKELQAGLYPNG